MQNAEITTMCALVKDDKVLMINRKKSWTGWAFPGGHIEDGESISACIKREIKEETNLSIVSLHFKGIAHFFNTKTGKRHIVHNYLCSDFFGEVNQSCNEGDLEWVPLNMVDKKQLAEGMLYRFPIFFENYIQELYVEWEDEIGYTFVEYNKL